MCENGTNTFPKWLTITDTDQDENSRVRWCTEVRDDKLILRVRGNRPYAQILALRDVVGGSPFSSDPFTMPVSTAMWASHGGRFFWVRSDTQLDIVFSQPASGPAVQTIKVDPIPDLAGTIGVHLAQEAMKESPNALAQILGNWDCITRVARTRVPMPEAEALANAFALAEECLGHLLPAKAKLLLGAKNAVTRVPDYVTDMANGNPQLDFVVGTRREPTTTSSTSTSTSTTTPTTTTTTLPPRTANDVAQVFWDATIAGDRPRALSVGIQSSYDKLRSYLGYVESAVDPTKLRFQGCAQERPGKYFCSYQGAYGPFTDRVEFIVFDDGDRRLYVGGVSRMCSSPQYGSCP